MNYKDTVENSPWLIVKTDTNGEILFVNNAVMKFLDLKQCEIFKKPFHAHFTPINQKNVINSIVFSQIVEKGVFNRCGIFHKAGKRLRINWSYEKIEENEKSYFIFYGMLCKPQCRESTQVNNSEYCTISSVAYPYDLFNSVLNNFPLAVFIIDLVTNTFFTNQVFNDYFGKNQRGKNNISIPLPIQEIIKHEQSIEIGNTQSREIEISINNERKNFLVRFFKIRRFADENFLICGILEDFTLHRKIEAAINESHQNLERINTLKDEYLNYISHEIRTPLSLINLYTGHILKNEKLNLKSFEMLEQIKEGVKDANAIINDIVDISNIEAGIIEINKEKFDVNELITEIVNAYENKINNDAIKIETQIKFKTLYSDKKRIKQILNNLLSNAVKYTKYGKIIIEAEIKGNKAVFTVQDTGMGIEKDNIHKVFIPLYRENLSFKGKGMGIGLSICKKLLYHLNGKITVESEKNKGSTFTFEIPLD